MISGFIADRRSSVRLRHAYHLGLIRARVKWRVLAKPFALWSALAIIRAMLTELVIRDFALIAELHLELPSGLVILTGETGAGKSIILDALSLATGARADTAMVRHGAEKAEVSARFDITNVTAARQWLRDLCVPRRARRKPSGPRSAT